MTEKAIARAWADAAYKARLLSDPHTALAEHGVEVPAGTTVKVVENTAETEHLVLPAAPSNTQDLSIEELEKVAGGLSRLPLLPKSIARAWADAAYKAKLLSDPHTALAEHGVEVPAATTVKVVENTAETQHLVLPVAPGNTQDLSIEELEKVAAGLSRLPLLPL